MDVPRDSLTKEKRMPERVAGPARAQPNDEVNRVGIDRVPRRETEDCGRV